MLGFQGARPDIGWRKARQPVGSPCISPEVPCPHTHDATFHTPTPRWSLAWSTESCKQEVLEKQEPWWERCPACVISNLSPLGLIHHSSDAFNTLKLPKHFKQLGWHLHAKNSFRSHTPQMSLARGSQIVYFEHLRKVSILRQQAFQPRRALAWEQNKLHSLQGMCPSSPGPPRSPCAPGLTFSSTASCPSRSLKREKHGAPQEPFHSNYRNVSGERSLWVCFKIIQFKKKKKNFRGKGIKGNKWKSKTVIILEMDSGYMGTMLSTFALI